MGGSGMANYESPNYLTSIENYIFLNDDRFRSINLAEGGARLSNELSIFVENIPKLKKKPDLIIFFSFSTFFGIDHCGFTHPSTFVVGFVSNFQAIFVTRTISSNNTEKLIPIGLA
jgi:hypothetical protein